MDGKVKQTIFSIKFVRQFSTSIKTDLVHKNIGLTC